jgi:hypothetical protein
MKTPARVYTGRHSRATRRQRSPPTHATPRHRDATVRRDGAARQGGARAPTFRPRTANHPHRRAPHPPLSNPYTPHQPRRPQRPRRRPIQRPAKAGKSDPPRQTTPSPNPPLHLGPNTLGGRRGTRWRGADSPPDPASPEPDARNSTPTPSSPPPEPRPLCRAPAQRPTPARSGPPAKPPPHQTHPFISAPIPSGGAAARAGGGQKAPLTTPPQNPTPATAPPPPPAHHPNHNPSAVHQRNAPPQREASPPPNHPFTKPTPSSRPKYPRGAARHAPEGGRKPP